MQFLDIRDPAAPRLIGQTPYRPEDGYRGAHSGWFNKDETLFVQNDEAMQAVGSGSRRSWTFQRVFDTSSLEQPKLLSTFATESAVPGNDGQVATDGVYSVHNAVIEGDLEYAPGTPTGSGGRPVRPPHPREIASFVPPPRPASPRPPPRAAAATCPVWASTPEGPVLASDMNSGLWVFRVTADAKAPNGGGSGQPATPPRPRRRRPPTPPPTARDPDTLLWVGVAGLLLGLLAMSLVARSAAARLPLGGRAADQPGAEQREGGHVDRQRRVALPPATASTAGRGGAAGPPPGARDQTREPAFTPGSRSRRGCREVSRLSATAETRFSTPRTQTTPRPTGRRPRGRRTRAGPSRPHHMPMISQADPRPRPGWPPTGSRAARLQGGDDRRRGRVEGEGGQHDGQGAGGQGGQLAAVHGQPGRPLGGRSASCPSRTPAGGRAQDQGQPPRTPGTPERRRDQLAGQGAGQHGLRVEALGLLVLPPVTQLRVGEDVAEQLVQRQGHPEQDPSRAACGA